MNNKDLKNLSEAYQNIYEMPGSYNNKTERQKDTGITAKEEILDEALKGVDGKPLPVTDKDKKSVFDRLAQSKGNKPSNPGNKPDNIFTRAQAEVDKANTKATNDARAVFGKPPVGKPKVTTPKGPGGAPDGSGRGQAQQNKPKGDLLDTLAKGGSKAAQDVKSKLSTSGSGGSSGSSGSSGSGGGNRLTGGGSGTSSSSSTPAARPSRPAQVSLGAERRTPTSSELRAAQSARAQAKASGASRIGAEKAAVSAGIANKAPTPKPTPRPNVSGIKSGRLASALSSVKPFKAEEFDAFDLVLAYLVSEGHVETLDEALYVMMEMSEETICDIVEELIN